uniref:Tyr recombinase domain-containing protein n=1 Tax=Panagrolaimus sp. ES5 TaxID=591445 RepID=A0AC34F4A5_9BILA
MNAEDMKFTGDEIAKLLQTKAISKVDHIPQVSSSLFVVRNTGKPRLIINLSRLNKSLDCPRFKYEDLALVSRIISPVGWLAKYDMKSGYHHIGIHPEHQIAELRPTPERLSKTLKTLYFLKNKPCPTPRDRLKLTGQLSSLWLVLGAKGSLFTKNIYKIVCAFSLLDSGILMPEEKNDLSILEKILCNPLSKSLLPPLKVFTFSTDASAIALGVVSKTGLTFSRPLTTEEARESSTYRELLGVQFGILCFVNDVRGSEIHVFTDNQNIIPIIRKGSMVLKLNLLAIEIHEKLLNLSASVIPHWIPREENKLADAASRFPDSDDWSIMQHVFAKVNQKLGPADIDRFASCLNKKLCRFNSIVPSPGTEAVDAFTQDWNGSVNYCVPPINLLFSTVSFVLKHKCPAIIGFPFWPALPIMPLLLNKDGNWKPIIKDIFRIPKGEVFLIPGSDREKRLIMIAQLNPGKTIPPEEIEACLMAGLSEATKKTYTSEFAKFGSWRDSLSREFEISDEELLPLYLMTVARESRSKAATVTAALSFFGKKNAFPNVVVSPSPLLNLVNKGISKKAPPVRHKEQVNTEELLSFFPLARSSDKFESRIGTLVVLLFSDFLRPNEALSLLKSNLIFGKENLEVKIIHSKANQNGSPEKVFISRLNDDRCPVKILEDWLLKMDKSIYVFPSFSGADRPWSYDAALKELKSTIAKLGIKKNITLHSFRGSAATAAVEAGCSEAELDRGCRWKSSSSKKSYVQSSSKSTKNVSSILGNI